VYDSVHVSVRESACVCLLARNVITLDCHRECHSDSIAHILR
jgi:hypothetical protein